MDRNVRRSWLIDLVAGVFVGGVLAMIVAVNLVIYMGVEGGYEADLGDVFAHSLIAGILVITVLASGPILGVTVARRRRHKRELAEHNPHP